MYYEQQMSAAEIGVKIGCTDSGVLAVLRRLGKPRRDRWCHGRKYSLDESFFDSVDTEAKAYWLGFLYADGYHNEKLYGIVLALQERDGYILSHLKESLKSNRPVETMDKRKPGRQNQRVVRINSKAMSKRLSALGLKQAKSLTLQFPTSSQVPDHLLHHFVRGYFDGDGCVSLANNDPRYACVVICVSKSFGIDMLDKMAGLGITLHFRKPQSKISNLQTCGRLKCLSFLDYIYKDASVFLTRKHDKYLLLKGYISPKTPKTSKYFGVGKEGNYWKSSCRTGGKQHYLGISRTEEEAAKKCDEFVRANKLDKPINFPA